MAVPQSKSFFFFCILVLTYLSLPFSISALDQNDGRISMSLQVPAPAPHHHHHHHPPAAAAPKSPPAVKQPPHAPAPSPNHPTTAPPTHPHSPVPASTHVKGHHHHHHHGTAAPPTAATPPKSPTPPANRPATHHSHSPSPAPISGHHHLHHHPAIAPPPHPATPKSSPPAAKPPTAAPPKPHLLHHPLPPVKAPLPSPSAQKKSIAICGSVRCKSCNISTPYYHPIEGALVKIACNNTKYHLEESVHTDRNGSFFLTPKIVTSAGWHKCKVFLVSSGNPHCNVTTNLNLGHVGAPLNFHPPSVNKTLPYPLFTVGPFQFVPSKNHKCS
ncbi:unnamed protein product [Cuscuta epithymum]|uniref:Uncharacterized protein n=1 Tax=Cuscuta epithymum TaxID=186058 RepID=A0AAV0CS77_9ASTE|nr:unnamed protein product [Cuscuta epithymum]